jgi:hypothetical protein
VKPTNFHNLQLTLHFVIIAVLFEPLLEVIDIGGLQCFTSGETPEMLKKSVHQTLDFAGILLALLLQRQLFGVYQRFL